MLHQASRVFRGSVREEFVDQLKRVEDLNTVFLAQISADRDPASRENCLVCETFFISPQSLNIPSKDSNS